MSQIETPKPLSLIGKTGEEVLEAYKACIWNHPKFAGSTDREKMNYVLDCFRVGKIEALVALRKNQREQRPAFEEACGKLGHVYKNDPFKDEADVCIYCGRVRGLHDDKHPIGTRIRFKADILEGATGDHPAFILAEEGDFGTIVGHNDRIGEGYMLKWDKWEAPFGGSEKDFDVIES